MSETHLALWRQEIDAHYTGPHAETTIDRDPTPFAEGQGIAWASLKFIILCLLDDRRYEDMQQFRLCLLLREASGPGRYHRKPEDAAVLNAHDDLLYAAVASMVGESDRAIARSILAVYRSGNGSINNMHPEVEDLSDASELIEWAKSWQGRHLWFLPLLKTCAGGEALDWPDKLALGGDLIFSAIRGQNESGILKSWIKTIAAYKAGGRFLNFARALWIKRLMARYPDGMAGVCAVYFNRKGIPHPFSDRKIWALLKERGWQ